MKLSSFRVGTTPGVRTTDFHIGRYCLAKHFATSEVNALDANPKYARQLLLAEPSDFPSGRIPIFVCERCAGLDCGATTVAVTIGDGVVTWQDFGIEVPYGDNLIVSEVYARSGPFHFDLTDYRSALLPYGRRR
jgi:hypothetical protein